MNGLQLAKITECEIIRRNLWEISAKRMEIPKLLPNDVDPRHMPALWRFILKWSYPNQIRMNVLQCCQVSQVIDKFPHDVPLLQITRILTLLHEFEQFPPRERNHRNAADTPAFQMDCGVLGRCVSKGDENFARKCSRHESQPIHLKLLSRRKLPTTFSFHDHVELPVEF